MENIDYGSFEIKKIKPAEKTPVEKDPLKVEKIVKKSKKKIVNTAKPEQSERKVIFSIGFKLISIITSIVVISLGVVTFLVTYFITSDTRINAEENNLTINSRTASDAENRLSNVVSNTSMLLDMIQASGNDPTEIRRNTNMFFSRNKEIAAVYLSGSDEIYVNNVFFVQKELEPNLALSFFKGEDDYVQLAESGVFKTRNASGFFSVPMLALFVPELSSEIKSVCVLYSIDDLFESFAQSSVNSSVLVNTDGDILICSDFEQMKNDASYAENVFFKKLSESSAGNQQSTLVSSDGVEYIGAYNKLDGYDSSVITEVRTDVVFEAVNATTRRNIYLTLATLSIAILIIWFFSKSLSSPLKLLTQVTEEINKGNFNTELFEKLQIKSRDEIAVLTNSTKNEREILNTFTKMTNKGVTEAIIRKKIDFEPHLKDITIFFSDIRGFTAISDGFKNRFKEQSAAEIISFLNDYMSRMVSCIATTGGVVDKFEGDAIMACWGVLRNDNLAFEKFPDSDPRKKAHAELHQKHMKEDAVSAVKACTAMRYSLMKYNKDAKLFTKQHEKELLAKYKPEIRIGCGLNSGRATVGFMGSNEKMEFTSIGDSVNFASRTEASNKPCGTDMLISEDTYNLLKMDYIKCKENNFTIKPENLKNEIIVEMIPVSFEVKGKGKQHFYGVVNMPQFDIEEFFKKTEPNFKVDEDCRIAVGPKGPSTLKQLRDMLGIAEPDFGGVNLDAEENKVQVSAG